MQGLLKFQMQTGAVGHGEYFFLSFGERRCTVAMEAKYLAREVVFYFRLAHRYVRCVTTSKFAPNETLYFSSHAVSTV